MLLSGHQEAVCVYGERPGQFGPKENNSHDEHEERSARRFEEQAARDAHPLGERSADVELTGSHAADETGRSQSSEELHESEDGGTNRAHCADEQQSEAIRDGICVSYSSPKTSDERGVSRSKMKKTSKGKTLSVRDGGVVQAPRDATHAPGGGGQGHAECKSNVEHCAAAQGGEHAIVPKVCNRFGSCQLTAGRVDGRYSRSIEPGGGLASDGVCRRVGDTGKGRRKMGKGTREKRSVARPPRSTRAVQVPADVLSTSKSKEQEERGADELPRQKEQRVSLCRGGNNVVLTSPSAATK
jgi:hypothetical protein